MGADILTDPYRFADVFQTFLSTSTTGIDVMSQNIDNDAADRSREEPVPMYDIGASDSGVYPADYAEQVRRKLAVLRWQGRIKIPDNRANV